MKKLGLFIIILFSSITYAQGETGNLSLSEKNWQELIISPIIIVMTPIFIKFILLKLFPGRISFPDIILPHSHKTETNDYFDIEQFNDSIPLLKKYPRVLQDQACKKIRIFKYLTFPEVLFLLEQNVALSDIKIFNRIVGKGNFSRLSFSDAPIPCYQVKSKLTIQYWAVLIFFIFVLFIFYGIVATIFGPIYQYIIGTVIVVFVIGMEIRLISYSNDKTLVKNLAEKYNFIKDNQTSITKPFIQYSSNIMDNIKVKNIKGKPLGLRNIIITICHKLYSLIKYVWSLIKKICPLIKFIWYGTFKKF